MICSFLVGSTNRPRLPGTLRGWPVARSRGADVCFDIEVEANSKITLTVNWEGSRQKRPAMRASRSPRSLQRLPFHTRWGAFAHPAVEAAFWQHTHAAAAATYDVLIMGLLGAGHGAAAVLHGPRAIVATAAAVWVALAAVWIAYPKTAARLRTRVLPVAVLTLPLFGTANLVYRRWLNTPFTPKPGSPGWRSFVKAPRATALAITLTGFVLPPAVHAAAAAASAVAAIASARVSADARAVFVGHTLHSRAAAALTAAREWLGLPPAPRQRITDGHASTLAVTLFLQLVLGIGGGCAGHALVAASLRRRFRRRTRGPPRSIDAATLDATAPVDAIVLVAAAVAGLAAALWWALEHVLPV